MADVATLGLRIDSTGLITANKRLKEFEGAAVKAEDAAEDFGNAAQRAGDQTKVAGNKIDDTNKRLGRFGRSAGQAGIQIQQFVGQVQGGVSPMVALSQQATDLGFVLGFPLLGAVTGIAAALAGPLVSSLFEAGEEVETTAERLANLTKAMDDARESGERLAIFTNIQDITRIGEEIDTETKKLRELEDQLRRFEQMETIGNLVPLQTEIQQQRQIVDLLEADYDRLNQQGTILVQNFEDQAEAAKKSSRGMSDAEREALRLARAIEQQEKSAEGMIESFRSQAVAQQHGRAEAIRYTVAIEAAKLQNAELAARLVEAGNAYADTITEQQKATKGFLELKAAFDPLVAIQAKYIADLKEIDKAGLSQAETTELQADALNKYNEALAKNAIQMQLNEKTADSFFGAFAQGMRDTAVQSESSFEGVREAGQNALDSLSDGIAEFVATGEADFRSFAASVIQEMLKIQTMELLQGGMDKASGFLGDFISGAMGGGGQEQAQAGGDHFNLDAGLSGGSTEFRDGWMSSLTDVNGAITDTFTNAITQSNLFGSSSSNVANVIGGQLVSSLVQTGTQMALNATIGQTAQAAITAASVAQASALAAAWAPAAAAASLATAGANAVPASAGLTSTYALSQALAMAGGGGQAFAKGGVPGLSEFSGSVVDKPTMFAAGGSMNLMGEAGAEAILPLKRTKSGDLGVQAQIGGGGATSVNVPVKVINVSERPEDFLSSAAGEKLIVNIMSRNRRAFSG